jgi:hypothetical protein
MISARIVSILAEVGMWASMSSILILLALSALSGFVLGISYFSWLAILPAVAVLAPLSAVVLQNQGLGALSGISVVVACLAINQAFYVIGAIHADDGPPNGSVENLPDQRANDEPHDGRDDDVRRQHERQQNTQLNLVQLANQRQAALTP